MRDRERRGQGMMGSDFYNSSRSGHESNWDNDNSFTFGRRGSTFNDPSRYTNADRDRYGDSYLRSNASSQGWNDYDNDRSQSSFGRDRYRDWSDRAGDEVKSWFGDDDAERRRNRDEWRDNDRGSSWFGNDWDRDRSDSWFGHQSYRPSTRDHYDNSRTIDSGQYNTHRYNTSNDNYTGYGTNYNQGSSLLGRDNDRYRSASYGSSNRYDRDNSWNRDRDDHDRGFLDRAGDEVKSWFGDEEAERRRRMDDLRDYADDRHRNHDRDNYRGSTYRGNTYRDNRRNDDWW